MNYKTQNIGYTSAWKEWEKILFRVAFVFFILMSIPTTPEWYRNTLNIDWTSLHYRDFYDLARFGSGLTFLGNTFAGSRLNGYAIWVNTLLASIVLGLIWTIIVKIAKKEVRDYNTLYYWLRVIVRYRAAIGIIGFGYTKLFPVQMPYPSESLLNNDFGDLTGHKIYWLSIGISPWYQVFGGIVEVLSGILLLFRKTATWGAALLLGALATITAVNFGYDGGVHVYASYFVLLGAFILLYDIPYLHKLLIREEFTVPVYHYPTFSKPWQKILRYGLKSLVIFLFLGLLTYFQWVNYRYDPYKQPSTPGIADLRGYYEVKEFKINDKLIPYSPVDSTRWSEVTFEKWSTLTFKVNKPVQIDLSNGGGDPMKDIDRTFEVSGVAGGRRVFHYYADTLEKVLYLEDKNNPFSAGRRGGTGGRLNRKEIDSLDVDTVYSKEWIPASAKKNIGNEFYAVDKKAQNARRKKAFENDPIVKSRPKMILHYTVEENGKKILLRGTDERRDSLFLVLQRVDRHYAVSKGKLIAGQYD
jgi:hypothetical protein